jgi:hypothetical protein
MCTTKKQQSSSSWDKKKTFRYLGKKPEEAKIGVKSMLRYEKGNSFYKFKTVLAEVLSRKTWWNT